MNINKVGLLRVAKICLIFLASMLVFGCNGGEFSNRIAHAWALYEKGEYEETLSEILVAEQMIGPDIQLNEQEKLFRLKGLVYYNLNVPEKFRTSSEKALEISRELCDTALIIANLYNLGVDANKEIGEAAKIYEEILLLAKQARLTIQPNVLEKLAQCYIVMGNYEGARKCLEESRNISNDIGFGLQLKFTEGRLLFAEDSLDKAFELFNKIPTDSLLPGGKVDKYAYLYEIKYAQGNYKSAIAYRDTLQIYTDSVRDTYDIARVEKIESDFNNKIKAEKEKFNILLYSTIAIVTLSLIIIFVTVKNLRLKHRQVKLSDRIAVLNVLISQLHEDNEQDESDEKTIKEGGEESIGDNDISEERKRELTMLLMEKLSLSRELLRTQSQFSIIKKLNFVRNLTTENKLEIKGLYDCIIGRFSDCCTELQRIYFRMTNDDCLYCVFCFCGCHRELLCALMESSDDALRKRKSRIKKKLSQELFEFLFEG